MGENWIRVPTTRVKRHVGLVAYCNTGTWEAEAGSQKNKLVKETR